MKYNKMMTKLLSGLILVSMAGTSLQIPTYADIMTARQVMADSQKEDNAGKDKGSTKKKFGAAGDDNFSLLGSEAEGKTNASGSDDGAEESNTPIGEERSSSLSSAAGKTSSKANNSSKSSSNDTSTSQVLEPFSTEGDSSLISLDQSFSLYSYHGYASSFTATALNGDGNDIVWEVGNVKFLSLSEPMVDGAKSTVKITWDGENVETIERTPFYAKLKSNPEEKVTGTIYLSNGQKPEGDEQEQEPGSRTEFESEEVRKFMEEMYAEGLTQDNSVYDLSSFGDGTNKNEIDYSKLTDEEIFALYEQQQNSEKAKTVDGAYEIAKAQLGKNADEKTDLSKGKEVDATELEKDTENDTLFNKEETQSEKSNENANSGKVDTETAQPAQKTTEVKTEKKTITTKTTTEVIATEDITETVTAEAVEPTEGEAADTDEAAVTETKIVGTKYTVRKTIVTETTTADGKTETDTKVEEYTTTTKPEEGTVVDTKEETVEVEVEVEADTADDLSKSDKTQTSESVKTNDTTSTPTTTKASTQSVEQSKSEKSDLAQLEKSTNAKSNNSGNVAKVETVVDSAYDSSNLEIARTYNTSKAVLCRAAATSEKQSADGEDAAVEQHEDVDGDDDDSDGQTELSEKSTLAKNGSRLTATEKTTDVDGEGEEEVEELTETVADSDDESDIAVMYDESEIMTTAVSVTKPMVSATSAGTVALKEDGTLWAWGSNSAGEFGTGNTTTYYLPQLIASNIAKISSQYYHILLLTTDGKVMVTGYGALGETTIGNVTTFTDITEKFDEDIVDVVAGVDTSFAITTSGEVYAWGYNNVGQIGTNVFQSVNSEPKKVVDGSGNPITGIKKIASAHYHTLALTNDGKIYSFGNNTYRQLGLSTTDKNNRCYANLVYDASGNVVTGATDIAAQGDSYGTSWYVKDGKVYGWGYNGYGQTGNTSVYAEGYNVVPREIVGGDGVKLSNVKSIYGGGLSYCGYLIAITNSGDAYGIGYNGHGELANGDTSFATHNNSWQRVKIDNDTYLTNVDSVAVEGWGYHTVFLRKDGTVLTSGYNDRYQLGMFTDYPDWKSDVVSGWRAYANELGSYPGTLRVYTNSAKSEVLTNSSVQMGGTFAIPTSYITGTVGYNLLNEKSITGVSFKSFNTDIATVNNSGVVTAGNKIGTAIIQLTATSTAFGGIEHTFKGLVRIDVRPQGAFTMPQVGAADYFNVALKSDGTVWTWGGNNYGGLARGVYTYAEIATPRQAIKTPIYDENNNVIGVTEYLTNIKQIAVGGRHALALDADGTVWAWGYNYDGQLGIGTSDNNAHPVPVRITTDGTTPLTDVVYISAGWASYAVRKDGTVWACGWNAYGQAGPYTAYRDKQPLAQPISGGSTGDRYLRDVIQIENGYSHIVALKTNGTVLAWGYNLSGMGSGTRSWTPIQVVKGESNSSTIYLENVVQVAIGQGEYNAYGHALALKDDGTVYGWGRNAEGQLGIGNTDANKKSPVKMNISDAVYISAGATQYYGASQVIHLLWW